MTSIHIPSAVAAAREFTPAGPETTQTQVTELVAEMRDAAETSFDLILNAMHLDRSSEDSARNRAAADHILVVDRVGWVKANALMVQELVSGLDSSSQIDEAPARSRGPRHLVGAVRKSVAGAFAGAKARSAGVQLGAVLGLLSKRVLGQYEPVRQPGVLLLNAPTILEMEQRLEFEPRDFRLWVAFHETTHRVQLALAPWIRGEIIARVRRLLNTEESVGDLLAELPSALRGESSLASAALSPEGRTAMEEATTIMTLLEGHADVMMDRAGYSVIPSVRKIRRVFNANRTTGTGLQAALMRLLGAGDKLLQYEDGAKFVREVIRLRGMDGFNRVWSRPEALPSSEELQTPELWVYRVMSGPDETLPS